MSPLKSPNTWLLLFGYSLFEYWIGKTKRFVASSLWELFFQSISRLFRKGEKMEKDIALGSVGNLSLKLEAGKAIIEASASESIADGAVSAKASIVVEMKADALVDLLFAAIEKHSPEGVVPLEEGVKSIVKAAVLAIK